MFVRIKIKSKLSENEEATIFKSRIIGNTVSVKLWTIYKAEQSRRPRQWHAGSKFTQ
jgi:hypothetical protein